LVLVNQAPQKVAILLLIQLLLLGVGPEESGMVPAAQTLEAQAARAVAARLALLVEAGTKGDLALPRELMVEIVVGQETTQVAEVAEVLMLLERRHHLDRLERVGLEKPHQLIVFNEEAAAVGVGMLPQQVAAEQGGEEMGLLAEMVVLHHLQTVVAAAAADQAHQIA
jgi:enamine deaminase RidA (YjgF/YER057c/UK114 family)